MLCDSKDCDGEHKTSASSLTRADLRIHINQGSLAREATGLGAIALLE